MDPVVHFTLSEAWAAVLAVCGGITALAAAVAVIIKIVKFIRKPSDKQNERLDRLEKEVIELKEEQSRMQKEYETFFQRDKERLDKMELENQYTLSALLALLSHGIDGNDIDGMKDAKRDLEHYLVKK